MSNFFRIISVFLRCGVLAILAALCWATSAAAQVGIPIDPGQLGEAHPSPQQNSSQQPSTNSSSKSSSTPADDSSNSQGKKGSRVFGVMPNDLTVEGATQFTPISTGTKFKLVAEGAFDPYEFAVVGILAGIGQATNDTPQWGQGAKGYGIRYGADLGDQVIGNFMVGAVFPSILRQDPRYFQSGKGSFGRRFMYALSRVVVTRGDNGNHQFNFSEVGGNALAAGISDLYHPPSARTWAETTQTWGTQIGVDAFGFEIKEFWPDIRRKVFKKE
jgi:hypothetical protein